MLSFLTTGIYTLYQYEEFRNCIFTTENSFCNSAYDNLTKSYGKDTKLEILFLVNLVVLMCAKYGFFAYVVAKFKRHDENFTTPSDFTLCVYIPKTVKVQTEDDIDKEIEFQINKFKRPSDPAIKCVKRSLIFDTKEHVSLIKQKLLLNRNIKIAELTDSKDTEKLKREKSKVDAKLKAIKTKYQNNPFCTFSRWCLVTFNTQKEAQSVHKRNTTGSNFLVKAYNFQRAPEPIDVYWENWGLSFWQRLKRRLVSVLTSLVIIAVNFGLVLGAKYAQNQASKHLGSTATFFINQAISIFVIVSNFFITSALVWLSEYESHRTIGDFYHAIVWKNAYSKFVNSALVVLIANKLAKEADDWALFQFNGLLGSMFIVMLNHIVVDTLLLIFSPGFFIRLAKLFSAKSAVNGNQKKYFQIWANESYEPLKMETYSYYNFCLSSVCTAFFYQSILPYGLLLTLVEMTVKYWTLKYLLVNRFKKPTEHQLNFSLNMTELIEFLNFLVALGFVTFTAIFGGSEAVKRPIRIIIIIVAGLDWVLGISFIQVLFKNSAEWAQLKPNDKQQLKDVQELFDYDYDLLNPLTVLSSLRKKMPKVEGAVPEETVVQLPTDKVEDIVGGDEFERCLEAYAVKMNNQGRGPKLFEGEPNEQLKLLEMFASKDSPDEEDKRKLFEALVLNPYQIIDCNHQVQTKDNYLRKTDGAVDVVEGEPLPNRHSNVYYGAILESLAKTNSKEAANNTQDEIDSKK